MHEKLRKQYLSYLAHHGLQPTSIPPEPRDAIEAIVLEHLKAKSKASRDDVFIDWLVLQP